MKKIIEGLGSHTVIKMSHLEWFLNGWQYKKIYTHAKCKLNLKKKEYTYFTYNILPASMLTTCVQVYTQLKLRLNRLGSIRIWS